MEGLQILFISVTSASSVETGSSDLMMSSHLEAGDGEAASVIRQSGDWDDEWRVWDVFIIEFNRNLIITWREDIRAKG